MTTIKIVGESWCPYTHGNKNGNNSEKGAWLQMPSGEQGSKKITYEKIDCNTASDADKAKFCDQAKGFPSFMDADGNTCTRGFDRDKGFNGEQGVTKIIEKKLNDGRKCA